MQKGDGIMDRRHFSAILISVLTLVSFFTWSTEGQIEPTGINEAFEEEADEPAEYYYELGKAYEAAGELKLAREAYINALKKNPNYVEVQNALSRVNKDEFAAVRALADLGFYTSAAELLEEMVKENAGVSVPEDLKYLMGGKISWVRQVRRWVELQLWSWSSIMETIGKAILAIIITILAFLAIFRRIGPWILNSFRHKHLKIDKFNKGTTELEIGEGLAAKVEDEFKQIILKEDSPLLVDLVEGPITFEIPADIKSVTSPVKTISELIGWIFPQKVVSLCGCQQWSKDFGAGLTLKLVNSQTGKIVANCTIWQKDFDPTFKRKLNEAGAIQQEDKDPTPYYCLTEPAAAWLFFHLVRYNVAERKKDRKLGSDLGTEVWQSYFYFRKGLDCEHDNREHACKMYGKALKWDPNNRFVLLNLGNLKVKEASENEEKSEEYKKALRLLKRAKEISEVYEKDLEWLQWVRKISKSQSKKMKRIHGDNVWYIAMYQIAATYFYIENWGEAKRNCQELKYTIQRTLNVMDDVEDDILQIILMGKQGKQHLKWMKKAKKWLEGMNPLIVGQYAIRLVIKNKLKKANELIEDILKEPDITYRSHYNVACYYAILGKKKKSEEKLKESGKAYEKALEHLKYALEKSIEEGIKERDNIYQWSQIDPSLKGMYSDDQYKKRFEKLTMRYGPVELE